MFPFLVEVSITIEGIAKVLGIFLSAAAVIGGCTAAFVKAHKWFLKQKKQDEDIASIKDEQRLMTVGVLACLDGLQQLGCNHTVPETRNRIEQYLNDQAHR